MQQKMRSALLGKNINLQYKNFSIMHVSVKKRWLDAYYTLCNEQSLFDGPVQPPCMQI